MIKQFIGSSPEALQGRVTDGEAQDHNSAYDSAQWIGNGSFTAPSMICSRRKKSPIIWMYKPRSYAICFKALFIGDIDVIVSFCIENGIYDIYEVNALLFKFHQPILG